MLIFRLITNKLQMQYQKNSINYYKNVFNKYDMYVKSLID